MMGVYEIINIENGRSYVGSAVNIKRRWWTHVNNLRKGKHDNEHLQRAWDKYGEGAFSFCLLEEVSDKNSLPKREQYYLDALFEAQEEPYNIAKDAVSSMLGLRASEETKRKRSESRKGFRHTEESKRKMSLALTGRKLSHEHIEKMRMARRGNKLSEEQRRKLSASLKGRNFTDEHRRKLSLAARGKVKSDEHRKKLSIALKGRRLSEEMRHKLSAIRKEMGDIASMQCIAAAVEVLSKPYPAFIHQITGEIIPTGYNLCKLCREKGLLQSSMCAVKNGRRHHHRGWTLLKDGM